MFQSNYKVSDGLIEQCVPFPSQDLDSNNICHGLFVLVVSLICVTCCSCLDPGSFCSESLDVQYHEYHLLLYGTRFYAGDNCSLNLDK